MQTDWDDTDTIAELDKHTGETVVYVQLGKLARIRYWARILRCRTRTDACPADCTQATATECTRMNSVMPATDWSDL